MRDLGQVVDVEAQVVRACAGLGTPVLHDLHVLRLAVFPGRGDLGPDARQQLPDERRSDGVEGAVLAGRRDDRLPGPGGPELGQADLGDAAVEGLRLLLRADDVEGEVLEDPGPDAVAGGLAAIPTDAAVVDRGCPEAEAVAMELAVDDRGHPPAGDGVLAQLEEAGAASLRARRAAAARWRRRFRIVAARSSRDRRRSRLGAATLTAIVDR
jgi:hypothetical protein